MSGGGSRLDRNLRPAPGPAPRIRLPRFDRIRLENGLTLITVRHANLPEVSARLIVPYGSTEDASDKAGTARLTARALSEGTGDRSAYEVARALDYLGARFSFDVSYDSTSLRLGFLSRVFDEALDLLAEIVTRPAFDEAEVERLRDERLDEIASGLDEPRIIAGLRLAEAIFGDHPYAMREGGTEETVRVLSAEDLRRFHRRFYRPSAATLVLVGDLPGSDNLRSKLEGAFGSWEGTAEAPVELAEPQPITRRVWAIDWSGPQSELRIGGTGIARLAPDYPAVRVMNSIVGGLFSSRINMNLREDKGWTYGARSQFDTRKLPGPFSASTAVDAEHTVAAVQEMLGEMEGMSTRPPTDEELALARNALILSMPRHFETASQVSGRVAHQVVYGLPDDYWERYPDQIRAVSAEDVLASAQRYLDVQRLVVVVVGPVRELGDELAALGDVDFRDIHGRPCPRPRPVS